MYKKWAKIISAIIGAVCLSAVGSGIWVKVLSPVWDWFIDFTIKIFSGISLSFKDSLYAEASKGFHEKASLEVLVIFLLVLTGFCNILLWEVRRWKLSRIKEFQAPKKENDDLNKFQKEFKIVGFIGLISILLTLLILVQATYINSVTTQSLNSIDIIAPFVGIDETLFLKSQFHRIKTAKQYEDFYKKLKDISESHNVELQLSAPL